MLVKTTILCLLVVSTVSATKLKEIKHWKMLDFDFPSQESRTWALDSGGYKQENTLPLGLEVFKDRIFVTVPRWKSGVPSSLNYVPIGGSESPNLRPYPNWETNNVTDLTPDSNDTKVVNVFRVRVDNCDRLWVVDCGLDDILGDTKVLSSPKILVFDLNTDKLIRVFKINKDDIKETSFFANIVIDADKGQCEKTFAYLPDLGSYGLIVYDWENNDAWRIEHHYFHFDPVWGDYNIAGVNFQWTDGIFGVSLKKNENDHHKTLYFHPLSSIREFGVSTEVLKNKRTAVSPDNYHRYQYIGSRSDLSQSTASSMDEETGIMFYTLVNKNAVGCWNSKTNPSYKPETNGIVDSDNVTMVFPNDLILDKTGHLWVLTDRLPVFLYRSLDTNDTNFRIMMVPIKESVKGTVCEVPEARSFDIPTTVQPSTIVEVSSSISIQSTTINTPTTAKSSNEQIAQTSQPLDQASSATVHTSTTIQAQSVVEGSQPVVQQSSTTTQSPTTTNQTS